MPKIFDRQFEGYAPKRIKEEHWFNRMQPVLLWMANTDYGRDLLCIDKAFPEIHHIQKNAIMHDNGNGTRLWDFRVGAKWANIIRYRWNEFNDYATWYPGTKTILLPLQSKTYASSTFYPDPNPESTSVDGFARREVVGGESWASLRGGAGTVSNDSSTGMNVRLSSHSSSSNWTSLNRDFFLFDTSALTGTVASGTFSVYCTAVTNNFSLSIKLINTTPASNTAIVSGDYVNTGTTLQSDTSIAISSYTTSAYNDYPLNSTGVSSVNISGITKFGLRNDADINNSEPAWSASATGEIAVSQADTAGTTQDPKLVITEATGIPRVIMF